MRVIKTEDFTSTMNLPKKTIPVDGNLVNRQSYFLEKIRDDNKYKKAILKNSKEAKKYKFANFPISVEDALNPTVVFNQILKDIYIRHEIFNGNVVDDNITFVDKGVENKDTNNEEESNSKVDNKKIKENIKAKQVAQNKVINNLKKQINEINKLGTVLNYNEHYNSTAEGNIEAIIIDKFLDLYNKKKIYRSFRPLHWCTNCKSPVDRTNRKYKKEEIDNYYILYNVKSDKQNVLGLDNLSRTYIIANTILPWTMISSEYIAVAKDVEYSLVQVMEKDEKAYYILASDMVEKFMSYHFYIKYVVIKTLDYNDLITLKCVNPLNYNKIISIIAAEKNKIVIDEECNSGIRIVSSGHSYLDYLIYKEAGNNKLKCVVNSDGITNSLALVYNNMNYKEVNKKVIYFLKNNDFIFYQDKVKVALAHCKSCDDELIYRSLSKWYLRKDEEISEEQYNMLVSKMSSSSKYKEEELKSQIDRINNEKEVVISDKNEIGIPIPVFYCAECGHEIVGEKINKIVGKIFKEKGASYWYKLTPEQILQGEVGCTNCGGTFLFKDSGSLNEFFKDLSIPFILNKDELNGSICIESREKIYNKLNHVSFTGEINSTFGILDKIMVHQVVEENMKKVINKIETNVQNTNKNKNNSFKLKKKHNIEIAEQEDIKSDIAIKKVMQGYGTDILRLWVMSKSNDDNITLNDQYMINTKKEYMNIRRTLKFLLSNLTDFNPTKNYIKPEERYDIDKILYVKLLELDDSIKENYNKLNFKKIYDFIIKFCKKNLCNEYFETVKYRLYVLKTDDKSRRSSQSTLYDILMNLVVYLNPIIPFTLEEVWPYIWHSNDEETNNILMYRQKLEHRDIDVTEELKKWERIYKLKNNVKKYISKAKLSGTIHHKLEATLVVNVNNEEAKEFIENNYEDIRATLGISKIEVNISEEQGFEIIKTEGAQCRRCRQYSNYIGQNFKYTYLCPRCADILEN